MRLPWESLLLWGIVGAFAIAVIVGLFNRSARLRRRRRRNHSPVETSARRPTVKFSVKGPKKK